MKPLSFFKGWSHLLVLNLLVKPVWIFCIDREIQNQVGYESYGIYFAVFNLSYILSFIADAGLSNMLNQKLAALQQISTGQIIKTKLLLSLVYIALVYIVAVISGLEQWTIFFYVVGIQLFTSWFIFLRSIITAQQYFTTDAWFSVIDKLLVILLCAGFLYYPVTFGKINLFIFLKIQLIATGIGVAIALLFVLHKRLQLKGDKTKFFSIIQSALPFAAIILLMSIHYRADGFL